MSDDNNSDNNHENDDMPGKILESERRTDADENTPERKKLKK